MPNLKLAFRTLFRTPFVTAVAILSLALGIGANSAIYSLFDQMLLRPLPVQEPDRLVNLGAPGPKPGSQSCNQAGDCDLVFSYPMFRDLQAAETGLSGIAAHMLFGANLSYEGQTLNSEGVLISGSYFPVLGLRPALGRLLTPSDDVTLGGHYVAVLSHSYWENNLGSDPAVLDRTIVVNGHPMTIVGVAPRGFEGTTLGARPRVYVPISMRAEMNPGFAGFDNRRSYWAYLFGRLAPGVTMDEAHRRINAAYRPILLEVEAPLQQGMTEQRMAQFRQREVTVEAGARGQSSVHGEARTPLLLLLGITGIVLLIACANIANLLLARGAGRQTEMAIRLSLGAGRRHVFVQLLTESLVLAVLGGAAGLLVAHWTLVGIASLLPPDATEALHLRLQPSVIWFAGLLAIGTGILFGMFPALNSTRPDLVTSIRTGAGQLTSARAASRFRSLLVTAQIALSMALLVSAGLFVKSLMNVSRVDLGVRIDNVVTFAVSPGRNGYDTDRSLVLYGRLQEELSALPGVVSVSSSLIPLLAGSNWGTDVAVDGWERGPEIDSNARFNVLGSGYFRTLGVPLLAGREFTGSDTRDAPRVAIVNEAFLRKFNLDRSAVGRFMTDEPDSALNMQIVGIVQNAKYSEVKDEVPPLFFMPYSQFELVGSQTFYIRTAGDPWQLLRSVPGVVRGLDATLPVEELKTLPQQVRENIFMDRMISTLSAAFALLATVLAAIGLYGVLAYTVAQRTREIGVRMALGADSARVRRMVLRQVTGMLVVGGVIGIGAALAIGRGIGSLLFGMSATDPVVLIGATLILSLVALSAAYIPAQRASRVNPMQALRYE